MTEQEYNNPNHPVGVVKATKGAGQHQCKDKENLMQTQPDQYQLTCSVNSTKKNLWPVFLELKCSAM